MTTKTTDLPACKNVTRVTHTTVRTTTITLTEEQAAQILRDHFALPNAQVEFECRGGYLAGVEIVDSVRTETEEPPVVSG